MFKKFLLSSFLVALFNFSGVLAGDADKGKKLYKKCAACHNAASGAKQNRSKPLGNMVQKPVYKMAINIQIG